MLFLKKVKKNIMKNKILILLIFTALTGCKTIERSIDSKKIDSVKNSSKTALIKYDSIFIYERDSIFIKTKNDTVFLEKWNTKIQKLIHKDTVIKIDTIFKIKNSVRTEYETITEEKKIYVKWLFWLGLAIPIVLNIAIKLIKKYYKK